MIIFIMGASGSGKSTVGRRLAEALKWSYVDTGEIFRESTEEWVVEQLKTAQLFDDEMTAGLVLPRLAAAKNAVLVGFPRNLHQAEILVEKGCLPEVTVELAVAQDKIMERLAQRGREQDAPEIVAERLAMYDQSKAEILAYLVGNGSKLAAVDGSGTPDEVYGLTVQALQKVMAEWAEPGNVE